MLSLREQYKELVPEILSNLNFSNKMEVPKIVKVSINMGLGKISDAGKDGKLIEEAVEELSRIAN